MKDMKYLDAQAYPGCVNPVNGEWDGGDSAAILGTVIALQRPILLPSGLLPGLVDENGLPRRHPDTTKWYGQSDRFSRDQLIPLICAGIELKQNVTIDVIFDSHKKLSFLTAWNIRKNGVMETVEKFPDFTGPEVWALWIRYKKPWWAWMVLWLLDIETLVGSILWHFKPKTDRVCRNHMLVCLTGMKHPTWVMRLAYWLNDWPDLIQRWTDHCAAVGEYPTGFMFLMRAVDNDT